MKSNKSALQKTAYYSGFASFAASITCLVYIYLKADELDWGNPVTASIMATSFFFATAGFVLITLGKCNLPNFKVGSSKS